jgi:hypothetical protein
VSIQPVASPRPRIASAVPGETNLENQQFAAEEDTLSLDALTITSLPPLPLDLKVNPFPKRVLATPFPSALPNTEITSAIAKNLEVDPAILESSPVLQRWLEIIPDVATDIQHDPAMRMRLRLGYAEFPSADNSGGLLIGVQDLFIGQTPLAVSAEYAVNGEGDHQLLGIDAQYYLLPLGWYGNVAPVIGYRSVDTPFFETDGVNLGFKIVLIPSRGGGADLSITQSWVAPGSRDEIGLTTLTVGYAVTEQLRIGTDIQTQNTSRRQESRVSVLLEWMP